MVRSAQQTFEPLPGRARRVGYYSWCQKGEVSLPYLPLLSNLTQTTMARINVLMLLI